MAKISEPLGQDALLDSAPLNLRGAHNYTTPEEITEGRRKRDVAQAVATAENPRFAGKVVSGQRGGPYSDTRGISLTESFIRGFAKNDAAFGEALRGRGYFSVEQWENDPRVFKVVKNEGDMPEVFDSSRLLDPTDKESYREAAADMLELLGGFGSGSVGIAGSLIGGALGAVAGGMTGNPIAAWTGRKVGAAVGGTAGMAAGELGRQALGSVMGIPDNYDAEQVKNMAVAGALFESAVPFAMLGVRKLYGVGSSAALGLTANSAGISGIPGVAGKGEVLVRNAFDPTLQGGGQTYRGVARLFTKALRSVGHDQLPEGRLARKIVSETQAEGTLEDMRDLLTKFRAVEGGEVTRTTSRRSLTRNRFESGSIRQTEGQSAREIVDQFGNPTNEFATSNYGPVASRTHTGGVSPGLADKLGVAPSKAAESFRRAETTRTVTQAGRTVASEEASIMSRGEVAKIQEVFDDIENNIMGPGQWDYGLVPAEAIDRVRQRLRQAARDARAFEPDAGGRTVPVATPSSRVLLRAYGKAEQALKEAMRADPNYTTWAKANGVVRSKLSGRDAVLDLLGKNEVQLEPAAKWLFGDTTRTAVRDAIIKAERQLNVKFKVDLAGNAISHTPGVNNGYNFMQEAERAAYHDALTGGTGLMRNYPRQTAVGGVPTAQLARQATGMGGGPIATIAGAIGATPQGAMDLVRFATPISRVVRAAGGGFEMALSHPAGKYGAATALSMRSRNDPGYLPQQRTVLNR